MHRMIAVSFISLLPFALVAKDYGIHGTTFPVIEKNLKQEMTRKLKTLPEEEIKKKITRSAKNPKPVPIKEAKQKRSFYFDPTYVVQETIEDLEGNILAKKGTRINPLSEIELEEGLLFFDGNSFDHIDWAKSQKGEFKWILIKGSPIDLEEEEEREVFFDQGGVLSRKFGITHIPCRVSQQKEKLFIEEVPIKNFKPKEVL